MRIACDASALSHPHNGIGRYLVQLLERMGRPGDEWALHARQPRAEVPAGMTVFDDGLPPTLGRIAAPFTTLPVAGWRGRPDLFWGPAHRLPAWLPDHVARVVTIHDLCWHQAPSTMRASSRWLDRVAMPRAIAAADRIIAVSDATRVALERLFPEAQARMVTVAEAAVPLPSPDPRHSLAAIGLEGPYVLFVGTPEPRKNLAALIAAFARVETDACLLVAGGRGWGGVDVEAIARTHGVSGRIRHVSRFDDAQLATFYAHARFLAMPSLYEGFGLPLLEALAHGTPVLYGDNSSMPEVAGDAGLPVDAQSVNSIADGMRRLLDDHALHATLASRARAQAAKFSWDRAARETLAVFEEAIAARQARRA